MTDARLPERYLMDRRVMRLNDAAFRSFVMAILWCVSNRTDGELLSNDLPLIPGFNATDVPTLVSSGLWAARMDGWVIADFASTQTSRDALEVLENMRRREREKKGRQRERKALESAAEVTPAASIPGVVPGDVSRGTTQERKGRKGQAKYSGGSLDDETGEIAMLPDDEKLPFWPVRSIPGEPFASQGSPRNPQCRLCGQESNHLDRYGLCQKVTRDHEQARKAA